MIELYARLSVRETAADADNLPPEQSARILASVQEILRQSGSGIRQLRRAVSAR